MFMKTNGLIDEGGRLPRRRSDEVMEKLTEGQNAFRRGAKAQRPVKQGRLQRPLRASASWREIVRFFLPLRSAVGALAGLLFAPHVAPCQ